MQRESRSKGVLFVCTGNICRSPIAEALFANVLANSIRGVVRSAGVRCMDGEPAHPLAQEVMNKRGIDLSGHRSRSLTPDLLMSQRLILVMEQAHQEWIASRMPQVRERVHLLGHWRNHEIMDPVHGGPPDFERGAQEIEQCLMDWSRYLSREFKSVDEFVVGSQENAGYAL